MSMLRNKYVQLILALIIGITIGAIFYPTSEIIETTEKRVEEKYEEKIIKISDEHRVTTGNLKETISSIENQRKKFEEEVNSKKSSYEETIRNLKSKVTEKTYKLIKPDGTIIEKTFKESDTEERNSYVQNVTEEFNSKVKSIEEKWIAIHKNRVAKVREESDIKNKEIYDKKLERLTMEKTSTITKTNTKRYNAELGYMTSKKLYLHSSYILWGPMSIGAHVDGNTDMTDLSAGLGLGISF